MSESGALVLEIAIVLAVVAFFGFLIGRHVYRKVKGLPTGECACCHHSGKKLVEEYHECYCKKK